MASSKTVVCVTGANGFLASQMIRVLLEKGNYKVHGTVRDPSDKKKSEHLLTLPGASERLKLYKADLLGDAGEYDKAIEGCEIVFHSASPFFWGGEESDYIGPAVDGTLKVLEVVNKHPEVKTVILTSSYVAVGIFPTTPDHVFTEKDWSSEEYVRAGRNFYALSKTLAERAAWNYAKGKNFKLVAINPCLITGPIIQPTLNTSSEMIAKYLDGTKTTIASGGMGFVDVRDVAEAHVAAAEHKDSEGRYLMISGSLSWQDVATFLQKQYGSKYSIPTELDQGFTPYNKIKFDCSKVEKLLGHKLISAQDSILESVVGLKQLGHIKEKST